MPFLCRIGWFGYGSDKILLGKGNSVPFLFQIGWLLYFLVNESAFFGCELFIFYNCHVQECKTSELGRIVGILVVHMCVSDFT